MTLVTVVVVVVVPQMAVTENSLFVFGEGASEVNMPMVNIEVQYRANRQPIEVYALPTPADVFVERTGRGDWAVKNFCVCFKLYLSLMSCLCTIHLKRLIAVKKEKRKTKEHWPK